MSKDNNQLIHQPPDYDYKYGHSVILKDQLYLGGEDDVDLLLYGDEETVRLYQKGKFEKAPNPLVDVWFDLRDMRPSNRKIYIPNIVEYITFPFQDGNAEEAKETLPEAKNVLSQKLEQGKRVLVTCHQGRSRSVMLLLWYLCEKYGSFHQAYWTIKSARPIMEPDKQFTPIIEDWKKTYNLPYNKW